MAFPQYPPVNINPAPITIEAHRIFFRQFDGMGKVIDVREYESVQDFVETIYFVPNTCAEKDGCLVWGRRADREELWIVPLDNPKLWELYEQCPRPTQWVEASEQISARLDQEAEAGFRRAWNFYVRSFPEDTVIGQIARLFQVEE